MPDVISITLPKKYETGVRVLCTHFLHPVVLAEPSLLVSLLVSSSFPVFLS